MNGGNYRATNTASAGPVTAPFAPDMVVLARVPSTSRVTATYLGQLAPRHEVVATLNPERIVDSRILPALKLDLGGVVERERKGLESKRLEMEIRLESLSNEVAGLVPPGDANARIQPFIDFVYNSGRAGGGFYNVKNKIANNEPLSSKDVSSIVQQVYGLLKAKREVPKAVEYALLDYVQKGEADDGLIGLLVQAINPVFGKITEYKALAIQLKEVEQALQSRGTKGISDLNAARPALVRAVSEVVSGRKPAEELDACGLKVDVYLTLQQLTGTAEPEKPSLRSLEGVLKGGQDGLFTPFGFKAAKGINGVPECLKQSYLPLRKLISVVTLFDIAIRKSLIAYALKNEEMQGICGENGSLLIYKIPGGIFMPAVFPENHKPILTLYPDERVVPKGKEDDVKHILELMARGRSDIPRLAAEYFGMPQDQIRFEELIALQTSLMQLLPMGIYACLSMSEKFPIPLSQAKKQRAQLHEDHRVLLQKYESIENVITKNFGTLLSFNEFISVTEETGQLAEQLFGKEFAFASRIFKSEIVTSNWTMK